MVKVGITGGIGSGKTLVCSIFKHIGIPVFHADIHGKQLFLDKNIKTKLLSHFGNEIFTDNEIDTKKISEIVFNDNKKLEEINSIMHPAILDLYIQWLDTIKSKPYSIIEAAVLFESKVDFELDHIMLVTAPEELRIERSIKRDKTTREAIKMRIDKQMPETEKQKLSNSIINNDGTELLIPQVLKLNKLLIATKK